MNTIWEFNMKLHKIYSKVDHEEAALTFCCLDAVSRKGASRKIPNKRCVPWVMTCFAKSVKPLSPNHQH